MAAELPNDPYWKLRPQTPTPEDELCTCESFGALLLCDVLRPNPIRCADCNGEVVPDRIGYSAEIAECIASWRSVHSSLYRLWLSSGDYESWAYERLLDAGGEVHCLGYDIVCQLNNMTGIEAYYWFFVDTDSEPDTPQKCPKCSMPMTDFANGELERCVCCKIVF